LVDDDGVPGGVDDEADEAADEEAVPKSYNGTLQASHWYAL
tara:strand:+ start:805 stop:927 length:123 start_codon:yes stop_codon:yes gene_type:complete